MIKPFSVGLLALALLAFAGCTAPSQEVLQEVRMEASMEQPKNTKEVYLAGGCFWGIEAYVKKLPGVWSTEVGYANGNTENPTYEEVCRNNTGHAETVRVIYDPDAISLDTLLRAYFNVVDPTTENRQGNDRGAQYRTGVYYSDVADIDTIHAAIRNEQEKYTETIVTEVLPLDNYYPAEEYHQDYLDKNPGGYCHIDLNAADEFLAENAMNAPDLGMRIQQENYKVPDAETLKKTLTDIQYRVTQTGETERPYTNEYDNTFDEGLYVDVVTGEPLFTSFDKFDSGCGWPSFAKPIAPEVVTEHTDTALGMARTEIRSRTGDAHLGHVFEDGPEALGGLRYCINSAAIRFIAAKDLDAQGYGYLSHLFQ